MFCPKEKGSPSGCFESRGVDVRSGTVQVLKFDCFQPSSGLPVALSGGPWRVVHVEPIPTRAPLTHCGLRRPVPSLLKQAAGFDACRTGHAPPAPCDSHSPASSPTQRHIKTVNEALAGHAVALWPVFRRQRIPNAFKPLSGHGCFTFNTSTRRAASGRSFFRWGCCSKPNKSIMAISPNPSPYIWGAGNFGPWNHRNGGKR